MKSLISFGFFLAAFFYALAESGRPFMAGFLGVISVVSLLWAFGKV